MNIFFFGRRPATHSVSVLTIIAGALLAFSVSAVPAAADGLILRKGFAAGENGAVGRTRGAVSSGEGTGAARRGGFAVDGQGNGVARRGGCVSGQTGGGCRGGAASWNSDGSFSGQSGAEFSGENGFFSGSRTLERDADGNVTAGRAVDASGEKGAYSGDSSFEDGTYNRNRTYTGNEGQSATVEGNWALGSGGSRTLTCVDSTGASVACR
jgi:hypothetical protein